MCILPANSTKTVSAIHNFQLFHFHIFFKRKFSSVDNFIHVINFYHVTSPSLYKNHDHVHITVCYWIYRAYWNPFNTAGYYNYL